MAGNHKCLTMYGLARERSKGEWTADTIRTMAEEIESSECPTCLRVWRCVLKEEQEEHADLVDMKMAREGEQQEFLEGLWSAVEDAADKAKSRLGFLAEIAGAITSNLVRTVTMSYFGDSPRDTLCVFEKLILLPTSFFGRTDEENHELLSKVLERCVASFTHHFHSEFLAQMVAEPEKVLGEKARRG